MIKEKGVLVVFSAPSGCGKGTVLKQVTAKQSNVFLSVSATTRSPREEDIEGVTYYFLTHEEFQRQIDQNGMLEYAEYCGNYYGTPRQQVLEKLDEGCNVVLEIEVQGAMKVKEQYPDAVTVFMLPPSVEELARRLSDRKTESDDAIRKRMKTAIREMEMAPKYDYVIINDVVEDTADRFIAILNAERSKTLRMKERMEEVLYDA